MRLLALALITSLATPAAGQVFDVRGGASSLYDGLGVATGFWSEHVDGWIGLGYREQWRYGGFVRLRTSRDSIEAGNNVLAIRMPTDVFADEIRVLVQGIRTSSSRGATRLGTFVGSTASAQSMPLFAAHHPERRFAGIRFDDSLTRGIRIGGFGVFTGEPTLLAYAATQGTPSNHAFAVTTGINRGDWYRAASTVVAREKWDVRASYIAPDKAFRRAALPMPPQTTLEGLNIEATVQPAGGGFVSFSRHAYATDSSAPSGAIARARGVSAVLGYTGVAAHVVTGTYVSWSDAGVNHSAYIAGGLIAGRRFGADAYLMRSQHDREQATHRPALLLKERVTDRLVLDQAITGFGKGGSLGLGGSYVGRIGEYGLHYQIVNDPFDAHEPFKRAATLSVRLQLGDYNASVSSNVAADGAVTYTAVAERFLYMGSANGAGPSPLRVRLERFVIHGAVQDESGKPVAGAAIEIEGELLFTDSRGRFLARLARSRPYRLTVRLDQFLTMESFAVVSAPESVRAEVEGRAVPIVIVVRR